MNGTFPGDRITRQVLFAVELLDPVSGDLVSSPAQVSADGLGNGPVINLSGRFVFPVQPGIAGTVRVDLQGLPYEPISAPPPAASGTLLRLTLQPSTAYPFAASATLLRARLVDGAASVAGAAIRVTFADAAADHSALPATSDAFGAFAVLLRLDATAVANGDPVTADLTLRFTRGGMTKLRPGLRASAGGKTAIDIATETPITQFDWATL
jgi:hypothetical protein